ncbi:hypothetical protein [Arthrobacter sp. UM1]|uniref:hypothetical protein n=1 Tax=Arthrobacter sp. UM1 TaxID=2766776 RepID=UPI001CF69636|nr:hypothetical protein [Arthrobacter sp. UM1]MCB4209160.1 hypothetical protein [Arthrobacter sp. UM1]
MASKRLHRALGAAAPLFELQIAGRPWRNDHTIISLSISRGDAGSPIGWSPSTLTTRLPGAEPITRDTSVRLKLTAYGARRLHEITSYPAASLEHRFFGRLAMKSVEDRSDTRQSTQLVCSDWSALIEPMNRSVVVTPESSALPDVYRALLKASGIPVGLARLAAGHAWDAVAGLESGPITLTASDIRSRYCEDLGIFVRTLRNGDLEAQNLSFRAFLASQWKQRWPHPLTRRAALSAASWEQQKTTAIEVRYIMRDPTSAYGATVEKAWTTSDSRYVARPEPVDLTHIWPRTGQLDKAMKARAVREGGARYRVPTVRVDLLALLSSDKPSERHLAGQLLAMEHGDPITLSHDWPEPVGSVYFVQQIQEEIRSDTWQMTLGLTPHELVTGDPSPDIAGTTWHTAYPKATRWNAVTEKWSQK